MVDDARGQPPSGGEYPPPPPVDEPLPNPSRGPLVWGVVLGIALTAIGSIVPSLVNDPESVWFGTLLLIPVAFVVGVGLTIARSTRRIGSGMLLGSAVGLVVSSGVCFVVFTR